MNTQDNNKQSNEALQGWVVIAGKRYSIAPKIDTGSDIDVFMKEQAIEDQRFYAAKVAFKGPQLLNGLAPSYEELSYWVMMGPIVRLTDYSFYPTEPNGALFRRIMADIERSDEDNNRSFFEELGISSGSNDDKPSVTYDKILADMKELMKAYPPLVVPHPFLGYPEKFLLTVNPKVNFDLPLLLSDVTIKGGLGNLKIIFPKKRQPRPEDGKYYIDMEMPMDDKWFEAFLKCSEDEEKKDD